MKRPIVLVTFALTLFSTPSFAEFYFECHPSFNLENVGFYAENGIPTDLEKVISFLDYGDRYSLQIDKEELPVEGEVIVETDPRAYSVLGYTEESGDSSIKFRFEPQVSGDFHGMLLLFPIVDMPFPMAAMDCVFGED